MWGPFRVAGREPHMHPCPHPPRGIIQVAIISFFSEILLGPQGLLSIVERKGGF